MTRTVCEGARVGNPEKSEGSCQRPVPMCLTDAGTEVSSSGAQRKKEVPPNRGTSLSFRSV